MSRPSAQNGGEEQVRFWLEFEVISDGYEQTSENEADKKFTCFTNLPAELRLQIWECLIEPRIVGVSCFSRVGDPDGLDHEHVQYGDLAWQRPSVNRRRNARFLAMGTTTREETRRRSRTQAAAAAVPPLLHICRESRALGLKHYELAFAWKIPSTASTYSYTSYSSYLSLSAQQDQNQNQNQNQNQGQTQTGTATRGERKPRVWFNFARDTLLLLGDLEPLDQYGFNSPMVYFLPKTDTCRVRYLACALTDDIYHRASEHVFATLFHIIDRFPASGRLIITVSDAAEEGYRKERILQYASPTDNPIQMLWRGWINGKSIVTNSLDNTQILMIREEDLATFIREDCTEQA
ncbi:hypothetical protein QBC46DRAFT_368861 [Diplogelasinospora grovesii]|uniref:2EXR domain-containing protein n=1 Tax=Diplogelasinospora grovesii TaxID=303347 RepID=A0AAN6NM05_9PEZI|nr:hypothetical protein QBC46DRAFT_368861 [Diplogelasinospora grovesii]